MITKELIEYSEENGMIYFMLASMISADNNDTKQEILNNLKLIKEFKEALSKTDLSEEKKKEYLDYLDKGVTVLVRDLNEMRQEEKSLSYEEYSRWHLVKGYEE